MIHKFPYYNLMMADPGEGGGGGGDGGGGAGGGGDGSTYNAHDAEDGTANTGGGAGGARNDVDSKAGGSGVIILKYNTLGDMTVVSTSQTALTTPADVRMVALMTPSVGTITLNTDFKGYVSRDGGTTYTQVTLVDEGTSVGTTKIVAGTADISSQPSGTSMVYKIESLNQSGSKQLNLNGTSLSWQ